MTTTPNLPPLPTGLFFLHPEIAKTVRLYALVAYQAGRDAASASWPTHEFAIVVDRMYEGEGPSLAIWNGSGYQLSDGDCYQREADDTLDGCAAEWLTQHQLEQRLFAKPLP